MPFTSGFFNALNHDRRYNAETVSSIFDGILRDGVFSTIGGCLTVKAVGTDMRVYVSTGRAWFDHSWSLNDSNYYISGLTSHVLLKKRYAIVLEVNHSESVRANSIKVIEGTASASPENPPLTDSTYVHQYPLATIDLAPKQTVITQANITNYVGTGALYTYKDSSGATKSKATPFASGILTQITTDQLISQWWAQFHEWFRQLNIILSGDVAGNLANEILKLKRVAAITIPRAGWTGSAAPYVNTVNLTQSLLISADSNPELYSNLPLNASKAQQEAYNKNFIIISSGSAETKANQIIFRAYELPTADISVLIKGY